MQIALKVALLVGKHAGWRAAKLDISTRQFRCSTHCYIADMHTCLFDDTLGIPIYGRYL